MINIQEGTILTIRQRKMQFKGWDTFFVETTAKFMPLERGERQAHYVKIEELEDALNSPINL